MYLSTEKRWAFETVEWDADEIRNVFFPENIQMLIEPKPDENLDYLADVSSAHFGIGSDSKLLIRENVISWGDECGWKDEEKAGKTKKKKKIQFRAPISLKKSPLRSSSPVGSSLRRSPRTPTRDKGSGPAKRNNTPSPKKSPRISRERVLEEVHNQDRKRRLPISSPNAETEAVKATPKPRRKAMRMAKLDFNKVKNAMEFTSPSPVLRSSPRLAKRATSGQSSSQTSSQSSSQSQPHSQSLFPSQDNTQSPASSPVMHPKRSSRAKKSQSPKQRSRTRQKSPQSQIPEIPGSPQASPPRRKSPRRKSPRRKKKSVRKDDATKDEASKMKLYFDNKLTLYGQPIERIEIGRLSSFHSS